MTSRGRASVLAAVAALALGATACGEADDERGAAPRRRRHECRRRIRVPDATATTAGADPGGARNGERLQIVTTVAPITSIVANIAGDRADVRGVIPEGTNSHTYEPKPSVAAAGGRRRTSCSSTGSSSRTRRRRSPTPNLPDGAADRRARHADDHPRAVPLRLLVPAGRRQAEPAPVDQPADGQVLRRDRGVRRWPRPTRRTPPYLPGQPHRSYAARLDELDALMVEATATVPGRRPRAAHLPRRLRLLRRPLRLDGDRRDPGVRLRGPDARRRWPG